MNKLIALLVACSVLIAACKKDSVSPGSTSFWGCHSDTYYYTYPSGSTDTITVLYISDDSLAYATHSGGAVYLYTYKIKGDSVLTARYDNGSTTPAYYGGLLLNSQKLSIADALFHSNGTLNYSATSSYNSEGRVTHSTSDYGTYQHDYTYYYDGAGNLIYSIHITTGLFNARDSFVYEHDLSHFNNAYYSYPYFKLYGIPEKNIVTRIKRYDAAAATDTLKSYSDYSYIFDPDGFISQKTTVTTYAGSGSPQTTIERFDIKCSN